MIDDVSQSFHAIDQEETEFWSSTSIIEVEEEKEEEEEASYEGPFAADAIPS